METKGDPHTMNKTIRNTIIGIAAITTCMVGTKAEAYSNHYNECQAYVQQAVDAVADGYTKREILRGPGKAWGNAGCYYNGQLDNIIWAADMAEFENGI